MIPRDGGGARACAAVASSIGRAIGCAHGTGVMDVDYGIRGPWTWIMDVMDVMDAEYVDVDVTRA